MGAQYREIERDREEKSEKERKFWQSTHKTVVAVPTNNNLAFSPPALLGWIFVSLASGRESGTSALGGRSLVAGCALLGSRVRCFIIGFVVVIIAALGVVEVVGVLILFSGNG